MTNGPAHASSGSEADRVAFDFDFIVVGSGFGGSVAALRLTEKGYRVAVMEMGRRWAPNKLPRTTWSMARWLWRPEIGLRGFFSLRIFRHVVVLHGNAVGGGSITYANTLLVPPDNVWSEGTWAGLQDWRAIMPAHFATAKRMLGVTANRRLGPADWRLKEMADAAGVGDTFYPTDVGVFFGKEDDAPGTLCPDPYFGGDGPARTTCIACGGCMVGCRHGAKNTLDLNYLYLAEKNGAKVFADTKVIDIVPLGNVPDGAAGYGVTTKVMGAMSAVMGAVMGGRKRATCRAIVFAASSLGTQELLFRLKQRGSLPRISDALGRDVITNAESLIGVRYPRSGTDLSEGVAIGSGIYLDAHTHIEATRYPNGSDSMGLITTLLAPGRPGWNRRFAWIAALIGMIARRPRAAFGLFNPRGFARESMIFLCMQTLDGRLRMLLKRAWYWPFMKRLVTRGKAIPTFIPQANDFAIRAAQETGGVPMTSITEILFNIPMTAHCMGGAAMARDRREGVCDGSNRVFGYANMYICDGSVLGANLGVNPSLTITAIAEHAMSAIPPAADQRWNDRAADPGAP